MSIGQREAIMLVLPLPGNFGNARGHWAAQYRAKLGYQRKVLAVAGKPPKKPWAKVTIKATFYVWAKMDPDNAQARLKHVLDALKAVRRIPVGPRRWKMMMGSGWFLDDHPGCLLGLEVEQVVDRKNQRLEVTISPLA